MSLPSFPWREAAAFRAFLAGAPRVLVLFAGDHCPYSATFLPHFEAAARTGAQGWTFAVRELSEGSDPEWDAHAIRVTPTVVAFEGGVETARLQGRPLLGVTRTSFERWLGTLPRKA